jgi:hypothetical protein
LIIQTDLQRVMEDAIVQLTNVAYTVGVGTTQPKVSCRTRRRRPAPPGVHRRGCVPAAKLAAGQVQRNGPWMSDIAVTNALRQFVNANGYWMFPELRNTPPTLLGKPWGGNSNMSSDMATAASRFWSTPTSRST